MANRYWVGGAGTWNTTSTANWSTTSGGAAGASAPGSADAAIFDANSGSGYTVTIGENITVQTVTASAAVNLTVDFATYKIIVTGNNAIVYRGTGIIEYLGTPVVDATYSGATGTRSITPGAASVTNPLSVNIKAGTDIVALTSGGTGRFKNIDFTGFSGTLSAQTSATSIFGDLTFSSGMTISASTGAYVFSATSGTQKITTNGITVDMPFTFNGVGGTFRFEGNVTLGSTRALTLTNGTLNANDKNVTIGTFALNTGTKTLTLGSGTWTVAGATWNANSNVAGLTVSPSTGTISMTSGSAKTFSGGGLTWPTLNQGGAGALTIAQSNTFTNITNTVQPATITFPASTTTTVSAFGVSGTSGNLITINSSSVGTRATLSDASGVNSVSFCDIKDINATGGAIWNSFTSNGNVNSGNNVGWDFFAQAFRYIYTRRKNKVIYPL